MAELEKLLCTDSKVESLKKINAIIENGTGHGGFNLFDTVLKDHILTYEQSKGWALQGTYVYKEAVAGSRYGYPDFYNKCVEEKDLGTPTETVLGENTITLYTNANGHTFYDIADKEAIDAWYNTYGIAWYYGVDTENERIFLPRTKWFIQPSGEITEVNSVNEAGLPNITGEFASFYNAYQSGAFSVFGSAASGVTSDKSFANKGHYWNFDASLSNPIYGNSDTVQPPSINQLLYICVGNTNVESAVTDVVDVTTTENDTIPLGYSTYQNGIVPNTSWLKSQGQWNPGKAYTTFYNEFVQKIGQSFASGYVKEITDEYDDYDLVINQDDMTFRLPLLDGSEDLVSDRYDDLTLKASESEYIASANGWVTIKGVSTATNPSIFIKTDSRYISEFSSFNNVPIGTTLFVSKGCKFVITYNHITDINFKFTYAQGNGSLYFKVANAVQNLELLDAGEVLEAVNNVVPNNRELITGWSFPSNKYIDLTLNASESTYTAPANGWFAFSKKNASANQSLHVKVNNVTRFHQTQAVTGQAHAFFEQVNKGDVLYIGYSLSGETQCFRFYYCNGEV